MTVSTYPKTQEQGSPSLVFNAHVREKSSFAATVIALYIFLLASRVLDVSYIGRFHIPLTLLLALTIMLIAKGDFAYGFSSKITKYFVAFTGWVIICWPFSYWRGGSTETVELQLQALLIFLIIVQLVRTQSGWEKVASGYAYAALAAALMSYIIGVAVDGRVALPGGSLGDPNAFALFMVVGLPFWWLKASRAEGFKKIFFLLCTLPIYPAFARAGSRSGMLAMAVLLTATFLFADGGRKILIMVLAVVGIVGAAALLPSYLKVRYLTFFSDSANLDANTRERLGADIQSSEGRKALLIQSINLTFQHPVLGVGPGVFYIVGYEQRKAQGQHGGAAYVTHNTYTQISSETGLPGFILFLSTVVLCFRYTLQDYRRLKKVDLEFAKHGRYMVSSMAALSLGIFFLSVGYTYILSITFALALSLHMLVERYLQQLSTSNRGGSVKPENLPGTGPLPANWPRIDPLRRPPRRPVRQPARRLSPDAVSTKRDEVANRSHHVRD